MTFNDFYQVFEETTICRVHDDYVITSSEFEVKEGDTNCQYLFRFSIPKG